MVFDSVLSNIDQVLSIKPSAVFVFGDLELLDKQQKQICRAAGPSLAASLEPKTDHQNVTSLSLSYRYYFRRCYSELPLLVPLPFSQGRSTR